METALNLVGFLINGISVYLLILIIGKMNKKTTSCKSVIEKKPIKRKKKEEVKVDIKGTSTSRQGDGFTTVDPDREFPREKG